MNIQSWQLSKLVPYFRNPRKNDHAIDRMAASITEYGFKIPILALSDGQIIDGHLRYKAAQKLGIEEVPVILCDEWSEAQVRAFRLLVNRSATWAQWDEELLALELDEIKAMDFDLSLTGFDPAELNNFLFGNKDSDPEASENPDASAQPVSQLGDVWLCGRHRVLCGDATSAEAVATLLRSDKPGLMVTDPPYGVDYDPNWRQAAGLGHQRQTGMVANDDKVDWSAAYLLFPGDVAYVWHAGIHATAVATGLETAGFSIRAQIIWAKQHFALSRGDYHWQHEPCWYAVRQGKPSSWCGDRKQSTLWQVANLNPFGGSSEETTGHGTQKPLELMRRPILNNSRRGDLIYDPFLGSGTTLIAAEETDRICLGIDIEPKYVDIAIRRWQKLTGKRAELAGDGRTFDELVGPSAVAPEEAA